MNIIKYILWRIKQKVNNNKIHFSCYIKNFSNIILKKKCKIHRYSQLDASNNGKITLGNNVTLNQYVLLQANGNGYININDNTEINNFTIINSGGKIEIGTNVLIGPRVNIIAYSHNFGDKNKSIKSQGCNIDDIIIEDDVWIGANCTILAGVKISKGAIIGANSLVNKDIDSYSINVGTPSKKIRMR
jgi:acetyltransferase-like isoleucine patch superfamily enzyme